MKKEDENIDELIASLVSNVPVDVSGVEEDWNTIKAQLTAKKKRRFIWWWLLFASFVAMGMSYYSVGGYVGIKEGSHNAKDNLVNIDSLKKGKKSKSDKSITTAEENQNKRIKEVDLSKLIIDSTSKQINHKNDNKSKVNKNREPKTIAQEKKIVENVQQKKQEVVIPLSLYRSRTAIPITYTVDTELIDFDFDFEDSTYEEEPLIEKKAISGYFEPIYVLPRYTSLVSKEFYKPLFSYSSGVNFELGLNKRFNLLLGGSYSVLGYNYTNSDPIEGGNPNPVPNPGVGIAAFDANDNNSEYLYRAQYLNLQAGISLSLLDKTKWSISTVFMPEANILLSEKGIQNYASKLSSSLNLGVATQYKITKSLGMFIHPNLKYMYLGYRSNSEPRVSSYVIGVRTGVCFKF